MQKNNASLSLLKFLPFKSDSQAPVNDRQDALIGAGNPHSKEQ
jgi:hypothetical protein